MEWSVGVECKGGPVDVSESALVSRALRKKGSGWNGLKQDPPRRLSSLSVLSRLLCNVEI